MKSMNNHEIKNFYEMMRKLNPNHLNMVLTAIDDRHLGEKALFSDHKMIWQSCEDSIFSAHAEDAINIEESGLKTIGKNRVFCEVLGQEKKLVICGGGHVSMPVIRMGRMMGYSVTVLEDRPQFADNARREGASRVICEPFKNGLAQIPGDSDTFFIIVTRGHRYDQVCLEEIVKKEHAYIGMIGSRGRVLKVKESILEKGADPEVVDRVYTPIGLDIGAETPEEIAVAIMAQIIEVKNKQKRSGGYSRELLKYIMEEEAAQENMSGVCADRKVLATIVTRMGSAPREVGTKMLILPNGKNVGTIGGGCVESEVQKRGLKKIRFGEREPELYHVDMSGIEAEDEGMVCGGMIDVLLEII